MTSDTTNKATEGAEPADRQPITEVVQIADSHAGAVHGPPLAATQVLVPTPTPEHCIPEPVQVRSEAAGLLLQAMARGLPTEQLELFLNHHREHEQMEQRARFASALAGAQGEYGIPVKCAKSDRGTYAPMDQDVAAIRAANASHGIGYFHRVGSRVIDGAKPPAAVVTVQCIVRHEGHDEAHPPMETIVAEIPGQRGPQMTLIRAIKGAATFLRRLTLEAAFGLAPEEDDDDDAGIRGRTENNQTDSTSGSARSEKPAAKTETKKTETRAEHATRVWRHYGVLMDDIEKKLGALADDWGDAEWKKVNAWRRTFKAAPEEYWPELAREIFDLELGASV